AGYTHFHTEVIFSQHRSPDCGQMVTSRRYMGDWKYANCDDSEAYVCEKTFGTTTININASFLCLQSRANES
ncbi:hypothetical protein ElyMa_005938100, partial [Elysia marginata]